MSKLFTLSAVAFALIVTMVSQSFALNPQPLPPGYAAPTTQVHNHS